jgi:hypothetical protein
VAPALTESATRARESAAFQVRKTAAPKEEPDSWREGAHDDMVLAIGVASRVGEHAIRPLLVWW